MQTAVDRARGKKLQSAIHIIVYPMGLVTRTDTANIDHQANKFEAIENVNTKKMESHQFHFFDFGQCINGPSETLMEFISAAHVNPLSTMCIFIDRTSKYNVIAWEPVMKQLKQHGTIQCTVSLKTANENNEEEGTSLWTCIYDTFVAIWQKLFYYQLSNNTPAYHVVSRSSGSHVVGFNDPQ